MAATRNAREKLRDLDERYAWPVNTAIAEGRDGLIPRYADHHLDQAIALMRETHLAG